MTLDDSYAFDGVRVVHETGEAVAADESLMVDEADRPDYNLHDLLAVLDSVMECCAGSGSGVNRLRVFRYWCGDLRGAVIRGRDGTIDMMAREFGISDRTVRRSLTAISAHPVLGRVFRYENCRLNGREPDDGSR